jgi:hypothetical protein
MNWKDRRIHAINRITQNIIKSKSKNKKEYKKEREEKWILQSGRV